jgi:hypothetical protein
MGGQIVEDDDTARLERGASWVFHKVSKMSRSIGEGLRLPISERGLGEKHLAFLATAAQARHKSVRFKLHLGWRTSIHSSYLLAESF